MAGGHTIFYCLHAMILSQRRSLMTFTMLLDEFYNENVKERVALILFYRY